MYLKKYIILTVLTLSLFFPVEAFSVVAFPGAEGFGKDSVGGRGGTVIKVTNLNDSGAGSFREAVETSGPRIIVFDVSGIINLENNLVISEPYVTIAGQTSPGGVLVAGRTTEIQTHNVIMQHMRFRLGTHNMVDAEVHDAVRIMGIKNQPNSTYNIIIDHCSFSWGVDEVFSSSWYGPQDITLQWSVFSEGLSNAGHPSGEHSKGLLISGKYYSDTRASVHHNYIAHNMDRSPQIGTDLSPTAGLVLADVVNNVVYNFGRSISMSTRSYAHVNWIHNYVKPGPDTNENVFEIVHFPQEGDPLDPMIYVEGNIGVKRLDQTADEWAAVGLRWEAEALDEVYRQYTKWPTTADITTATMSGQIAECILSAVGATAPARDSVDTRVVADFFDRTGQIRDNVTYPDDFPTFSNPAAPADTDDDGMADSWEESTFGNLDQTAGGDYDNDGYTNIEEYLHYLSIKSYTLNTDCMLDIVAPAKPKEMSVQ